MRRIVALAALIPLATFADPPDTASAPTPYPSVAAEALPAAERLAAAALDEKLDRPLIDLPPIEGLKLGETFEFIAETLDAGLMVDEAAIGDADIRLDRPSPTFRPGGQALSARTLLGLITEPIGLAAANRSGTLVITSRKVASESLATRVYDLRPLREAVTAVTNHQRQTVAATCFDSTGKGAALEQATLMPPCTEADVQVLLVLQQATGGPWFDIDGVGGTMVLYDDLLVVRQTEPMHAEIAAVLGAMKEARDVRPATAPAAAPTAEPVPPGSPERKAADALQERLGREIGTVSFDGVPLRDALEVIAKKVEADLVVDEEEVTDEGTSLDDPVTLVVEQTPATARNVLERLLRPSNLTYMTTGGFLRITNSETADESHETRVYNVRDLVRRCPCPPPEPVTVPGGAGLFSTPDPVPDAEKPEAAAGGSAIAPSPAGDETGRGAVSGDSTQADRCIDPSSLFGLIQNCTSGPWYMGGAGTMASTGDRLVIGHNQAAQAEVARLLADLRAADAEPRSPTAAGAGRCPQDFVQAFVIAAQGEGGRWIDFSGSYQNGWGSLRLIDGLLVVRQTAAVHAKIPALLAKFGRSPEVGPTR